MIGILLPLGLMWTVLLWLSPPRARRFVGLCWLGWLVAWMAAVVLR